MKKILKIVGFILGGILLLVLCGAAYVNIKGIPTYEQPKVNLQVESSPEQVARGKKIAGMLCFACHLSNDEQKLSGKQMTDAPPEFGTIYSSNITQDPVHGIGKYTDGEIYALLRTGIKPNGDYMPPYMPKLLNMSDNDMHAVIAFLKSNDPWIQPSQVVMPKTEPSFLVKFLSNIGAFAPYPLPEKEVVAPDTADAVAYGKYLVNGLMDCYTCHSADFTKLDFANPNNSFGYLGGGNTMYDMEGNPIKTRNITPHKETGIGNWTREQFLQSVKWGKNPDGSNNRYPMLPMSQLADWEVNAIYDYLMTVPAIENKVE